MAFKVGVVLLALGLGVGSSDARSEARVVSEVTSELATPAPTAAPKAPTKTPKLASILTLGKRPAVVSTRPGWLTDYYKKQQFLSRFEAAFKALDANGDGLVHWAPLDAQGNFLSGQPGSEPLPPSYDSCFLIDYVHHPATKTKDPAHPGQYIETPESYEITGWRTWKEVLATLDASGTPITTMPPNCKKSEKQPYCRFPDGREVRYSCSASGDCTCYPYSANPSAGKYFVREVCLDPPDVPKAFTLKRWLEVATDHFDREDWNRDKILGGPEAAEFVCPGD